KNDAKEIALIATGFQSKGVKCLESFLAADAGVEAARAGLGRYTSSRASYDDLTKVLAAMRLRDALVAFGEGLPSSLDKFDGELMTKVAADLKTEFDALPKDTHHVLGALRRRHAARGLMISLSHRGRDLIGLSH